MESIYYWYTIHLSARIHNKIGREIQRHVIENDYGKDKENIINIHHHWWNDLFNITKERWIFVYVCTNRPLFVWVSLYLYTLICILSYDVIVFCIFLYIPLCLCVWCVLPVVHCYKILSWLWVKITVFVGSPTLRV